jgi:hypothetical protein
MTARHAARASLALLAQRVEELRAADADVTGAQSPITAAVERQARARCAYLDALSEACLSCGVQPAEIQPHQGRGR